MLNFSKLDKLTKPYRKHYNNRISAQHSLPRFLFYLQHSISFSPFIDITKNLWGAVSFSLENIQKDSRESNNKKSAIYAFSLSDSSGKNPKVLNTHNDVETILKSLSIGINRINTSKKCVEAYIIKPNDSALLNDRMQYQKGSFLLLNNYSISNNNKSNQIYDDKDIKIVKYILSEKLQKELLLKLENKHNHYKIKYLYDPYLFLSDQQNYKSE